MSRYYKTARPNYINYGYDIPFEQMAQAQDMKQGQQDAAVSGLLQSKQLGPVREAAKPELAQFSNWMDTNIAELSKMDLTSPEGRRKYMEFGNTVKTAVGPTGRIGQLYNDYAAEQARIKEISGWKNVDEDAREIMLRKAQGVPYTPAEGSEIDWTNSQGMNPYNDGGRLHDSVDYADEVFKYAEKVIPNKFETVRGGTNEDGTVEWMDKKSGERITRDRILSTVLHATMSNPKFANSYNQRVQLGLNDNYLDENGNRVIVDNHIIEYEYVDPKTKKTKKMHIGNPNTDLGRLIEAAVVAREKDDIVDHYTQKETTYKQNMRTKEWEESRIIPLTFEGEPNVIKPPKYEQLRVNLEENTINTDKELQRLNSSGLSPGPIGNLYKMSSNEIKSKIEKLLLHDNREHYNTLLSHMEEAYMSKLSMDQTFENVREFLTKRKWVDSFLKSEGSSASEVLKHFEELHKKNQLDEKYLKSANINISSGSTGIGNSFWLLRKMLGVKNNSEILSSVLDAAQPEVSKNEYEIPHVQGRQIKLYDNNLFYNKEASEEFTRSTDVHLLNQAAGMPVYESNEDGSINKNKQRIGIPAKGSSVIYDEIARKDGMRYATVITPETKDKKAATYYVPMEQILNGGHKLGQTSNLAQNVTAMTIAMAQKGLSRYPIPGTNATVVINPNGLLPEIKKGLDNLHNSNNISVEIGNEAFYGSEATNQLIHFQLTKGIKLPTISSK